MGRGTHFGQKGEKKLSTLRKLDCEICLQDIDEYYDLNSLVISQTQQLIAMAADHPQGSKLLASGRVVILRDGVRNTVKLTEQYAE
jgi:antiviral helicase SKI2